MKGIIYTFGFTPGEEESFTPIWSYGHKISHQSLSISTIRVEKVESDREPQFIVVVCSLAQFSLLNGGVNLNICFFKRG